MDKNIRRTPFGRPQVTNQEDNQVVESNPRPKVMSNAPPKMKEQTRQETEKKLISGNVVNQVTQPKDDTAIREYQTLRQFNCPKNFLSTTSEKFPANSNLLKDCSFPLGLILNPFASYEGEIPIINYGENEIPRCYMSSCRAYINPFVKWIEGGDKWICNICKNINNTESYYYGKLDRNNFRVDIGDKADLSGGSYEFIANKTYMKKDKPLNSPAYIFIIDVSLISSQNGFLTAVIESIKDVINTSSINYADRTKVAFITYDTSVHFYCLSNKLSQPQMLCVSDDNIFLPSPVDSLLVDLGASTKSILAVLDLIQTCFGANSCKDSQKLFSAINAGYLLAKNSGAKLIVFNASQSMTVLPKMKSNNVLNIPKDELIYTPTDEKQLSTMGINLTNDNISCDMFIAGESYVNLVTLNQICDYTNGNLYFYKNFRMEAHYKNIFNQIRRCLTRFTALEAVVRTRFSRGYKIGSFITPVLISNNDLLICSALDSDQTYTFVLDVSDQEATPNVTKELNYTGDPFVYIQTAALYTHPEGTRRIRVHNVCIPVANRLTDIYSSIDVETLVAFYMKQTVDKIFKTKKISNSVLSTEASYKALITSVLTSEQSQRRELPENLVYLPLYVLGVLKHRICCKDELERKLDVDLSNYMRIKIQKMSNSDVLSFIFPRIYAAHQLLIDSSIGNYDESGLVVLPALTSTYYNCLETDGVYLIDNGYLLILYTKFNADRRIVKSLFGVDDISNVSLPLFEEYVFAEPDDIKQKIVNMVDYIRGTKSLFQNLIFVFEGTDSERIVKESLIEDNYCSWMGVDYKTFYANTVEVSSPGHRPGLR